MHSRLIHSSSQAPRANQFFKTGKNVDRLSQSIPNEFSTDTVELHCYTGALYIPDARASKCRLK